MDTPVRPSDFGQTITNREGHDFNGAIRDPK
jgi:hypothetical protein